MKSQTKSRRTVFEHPTGRFEVLEISGVNLMGDTFCYHEAVFTPKRDKRGIAHMPEEEAEQNAGFRHESGRMTEEIRERIRAMCREGLRTAVIVAETGFSAQTVRNITRDLREAKIVRKWTPSEKRRVMYMWRAGIGYAAIGKELGRNPRSVADLVQREIKDDV
ncbi:hypothetical protein [Agathobaculum sp.]|uniref:hypothetical protein n=1 Tax=Agathobaculum sp. TaxID=2048138 RepID=UPI00351FF491